MSKQGICIIEPPTAQRNDPTQTTKLLDKYSVTIIITDVPFSDKY